MKPIPVLGIPHFNRPDLLVRCIASIDTPVDTLVVIQQGKREDQLFSVGGGLLYIATGLSAVEVPKCVGMLVIITHPNAGCAGAWNEIIKLFPAPWWLITNNDIEFKPGDLAKMVHFVESGNREIAKAETDSLAMAYGNHGASWFGITAHGVRAVGLFDENIYPVYLEDCDWDYRAKLAGARVMTVEGLLAKHGDEKSGGSCTIRSDEAIARRNMETHGGSFVYYRQKWGGTNGHEVFKTPFDMPGVPVTHWSFDPARRARQQW